MLFSVQVIYIQVLRSTTTYRYFDQLSVSVEYSIYTVWTMWRESMTNHINKLTIAHAK
jgi:hypothetical protein